MATISWLRVTLMVSGILVLLPLTLTFGFYGFLGGLFFLLCCVLAT